MDFEEYIEEFNLFHMGREAASRDMQCVDFDADEAFVSFANDPADGPFQRGYLRELIKSGEVYA